jgi:hypothetical protein
MLDLRHRFGASGNNHAGCSGGDHARGVQHRLQTRAAASIHLDSGHRRTEAGVERGDPADRGGLAVRIALAEDDVVDLTFAQAGTPYQLGEHGGGEVRRGQGGQRAAEAAHRRTDRLTDHHVAHVLDSRPRRPIWRNTHLRAIETLRI